MESNYALLRKQSKEIFELIESNHWSDAEKSIKQLIPQFSDYSH